MKISTCGNYYENFQYKRVFIRKKSDCVTVEYQNTWKGKNNGTSERISLSVKTGKPIVYRYNPKIGIQNITYSNLTEVLQSPINMRISTNREKYRHFINKFLELARKLVPKYRSLKSLNAMVIRSWLPVLKNCSAGDVINVIPALSQPIVRNELKKESLEKAAKFWFGKLGSDEELISKLGKAIEGNFSTLMLAIACRDWSSFGIHKILESDFSWDCDIEIAKTSQLFNNYYNEEVWLRLLREFTDLSYRNKIFDLCQAIDFYVMEGEPLPCNSSSIKQILTLKYSQAERTVIVPDKIYAVIYRDHIIEGFVYAQGWGVQIHPPGRYTIALYLDSDTEASVISVAKQWIDNEYTTLS